MPDVRGDRVLFVDDALIQVRAPPSTEARSLPIRNQRAKPCGYAKCAHATHTHAQAHALACAHAQLHRNVREHAQPYTHARAGPRRGRGHAKMHALMHAPARRPTQRVALPLRRLITLLGCRAGGRKANEFPALRTLLRAIDRLTLGQVRQHTPPCRPVATGARALQPVARALQPGARALQPGHACCNGGHARCNRVESSCAVLDGLRTLAHAPQWLRLSPSRVLPAAPLAAAQSFAKRTPQGIVRVLPHVECAELRMRSAAPARAEVRRPGDVPRRQGNRSVAKRRLLLQPN